eukprot:CAMPEP_0201716582 /NCGR_PEP_ID=MMETSP0593-20130828/2520_1 /ASSEMBLY_ACC=CAM_ASM_000672 /TAXON_ID=267983 /ORGANISM="Skeletonema japonicum, Strain CCMP2506" /LENGTH=512 /DNA_ID=CAMNT_0048206413 /DNA_START=425 /DNA_END=1963 /DNA_ORIENTATION=-
MTGTNWIVSTADYYAYQHGEGRHVESSDEESTDTDISTSQATLLALATPTGLLHTAIVAFFLLNVTYNYYKCVTTSNSGKLYDAVVRELATVTNFDYPETEEELIQCKRTVEHKIAAKLELRRRELQLQSQLQLAADARRSRMNNEDDALTSTAATNNTLPAIPRIHNWQLLTPTEWSYCRFSKQPKPPRSHYDHVTKSLVLNMDHYCPWMFNCVGYFNYRYFVNFLFFTTTGLFYGAGICVRPFWLLGGSEYREQIRMSSSGGGENGVRMTKALLATVRHLESNSYIPTPNERTSIALGFMICLCLGCAVGCLLVFHLYLTVSAQTTIEFHGNWAKRRKTKGWVNPYSAGSWKRNWEMVYGTRYHHLQGGDDDKNDDEENGGVNADAINNHHCNGQYSYRGCWGVFMAMMPSKREPEFLPFPFDAVLIRRKNRVNSSLEVDKKLDEEMSESCPGLHFSMDNGDDNDEDVIGVFKKKSPSQPVAENLIEINTSNGLTDRAGRNTPRGEELMV